MGIYLVMEIDQADQYLPRQETSEGQNSETQGIKPMLGQESETA